MNGERWIQVKDFHQHKDYNPGTTDMDFAILELDEELAWTDKIRPACIPENDSNDYVGVDGKGLKSNIRAFMLKYTSLILQQLYLVGALSPLEEVSLKYFKRSMSRSWPTTDVEDIPTGKSQPI